MNTLNLGAMEEIRGGLSIIIVACPPWPTWPTGGRPERPEGPQQV